MPWNHGKQYVRTATLYKQLLWSGYVFDQAETLPGQSLVFASLPEPN
jgi:hypothetical protein